VAEVRGGRAPACYRGKGTDTPNPGGAARVPFTARRHCRPAAADLIGGSGCGNPVNSMLGGDRCRTGICLEMAISNTVSVNAPHERSGARGNRHCEGAVHAPYQGCRRQIHVNSDFPRRRQLAPARWPLAAGVCSELSQSLQRVTAYARPSRRCDLERQSRVFYFDRCSFFDSTIPRCGLTSQIA
jgi:hypothetical protein